MTKMVTYHGHCHCSAVEFEFQSPPITEALQCNCSICIRKNAIMSMEYIEAPRFILHKGTSALAKYHFNDWDVNHYFCRICGIYPFHDTVYEPGKYRVNLCCVEELEPRKLKITEFDGRHEL